MAGVEPLRALHYDLGKVGSLAAVTSPPYDVIDEEQRADLAARSPYNVVEIDLPRDSGGGDRYEHAAQLLGSWKDEGVLALGGNVGGIALMAKATTDQPRHLHLVLDDQNSHLGPFQGPGQR